MFKFTYDNPIVCAAIHNGHKLSDFVKDNLAISEEAQLREEDPFTDFFTEICENRILGLYSRFEFDVNRSKSQAIYQNPKDAWNLTTRKRELTLNEIQTIIKSYDKFYKETYVHLEKLIKKQGKIFIYDIHSYNHHRKGRFAEYDDPFVNPEIILGTNNMNKKWFPLINNIQRKLCDFDFWGRTLDVRINVKFTGGNFSRWIHHQFPGKACCVSIEFKKIFMDEWTGKRNIKIQKKLRDALETTIPVCLNTDFHYLF